MRKMEMILRNTMDSQAAHMRLFGNASFLNPVFLLDAQSG